MANISKSSASRWADCSQRTRFYGEGATVCAPTTSRRPIGGDGTLGLQYEAFDYDQDALYQLLDSIELGVLEGLTEPRLLTSNEADAIQGIINTLSEYHGIAELSDFIRWYTAEYGIAGWIELSNLKAPSEMFLEWSTNTEAGSPIYERATSDELRYLAVEEAFEEWAKTLEYDDRVRVWMLYLRRVLAATAVWSCAGQHHWVSQPPHLYPILAHLTDYIGMLIPDLDEQTRDLFETMNEAAELMETERNPQRREVLARIRSKAESRYWQYFSNARSEVLAAAYEDYAEYLRWIAGGYGPSLGRIARGDLSGLSVVA